LLDEQWQKSQQSGASSTHPQRERPDYDSALR